MAVIIRLDGSRLVASDPCRMLLRRCPAGGRRLCRKTVSRPGWMYDVACPGGGMTERVTALGFKTALLAYAAGDPVESLRRAWECDPAATRALVAATHPAWEGTASSDGALFFDCYPPEGVVYAGSFPGIDILCDRDVMDYLPSQFPARYLDAAVGRRVILHAMHSVTDTFAYAVWEDGRLIRSLCLSPGDGITENIGDPLPFEAPYWAGGHPAGDGYPLPFHPLLLGGSPGISTRNRSGSRAFRFRPRTPLPRRCSPSSCGPTGAPGTAWDLTGR